MGKTIEADLPDQVGEKKPEIKETETTAHADYKKPEEVRTAKPVQIIEPQTALEEAFPKEKMFHKAIPLNDSVIIDRQANAPGSTFVYAIKFNDEKDMQEYAKDRGPLTNTLERLKRLKEQGDVRGDYLPIFAYIAATRGFQPNELAKMCLSPLDKHKDEKELSIIFADSMISPEDYVASADLGKDVPAKLMPTLLNLLETDAANNHAHAIYLKTSDMQTKSFFEENGFEAIIVGQDTIGLYKILGPPVCPKEIDPNVLEQVYENNPTRALDMLLESGMTGPQASLQLGQEYFKVKDYTKAAYFFVLARTPDLAKECWIKQAERESTEGVSVKRDNKTELVKDFDAAARHYRLAGRPELAETCLNNIS